MVKNHRVIISSIGWKIVQNINFPNVMLVEMMSVHKTIDVILQDHLQVLHGH